MAVKSSKPWRPADIIDASLSFMQLDKRSTPSLMFNGSITLTGDVIAAFVKMMSSPTEEVTVTAAQPSAESISWWSSSEA